MDIFIGRHSIADLDGLKFAVLDDEELLRGTLARAVTKAGATVLAVNSHRYAPQGVSVVAILAESHASLHTCPEIGLAMVDVFTCGRQADPEVAVDLIIEALAPSGVRRYTFSRGDGSPRENAAYVVDNKPTWP
jgi:S-adenosylmethionine decarboxylase proenzyme